MSDELKLKVSKLAMHFGGIVALDNVSFEMRKGTITALIGPNGAGKTTVFNCITGFYHATSGDLRLYEDGRETDLIQVLGPRIKYSDLAEPGKLPSRLYYTAFGGTHLTNRVGIARTFQNVRLFREMTAVENLLIAQHATLNRNVLAGVLRTRNYMKSEQRAVERAYDWLDVVGLSSLANRLAGQLPYGHQRRLEIARAMATNPNLICLDEPAAGLNPKETAELSQLITRLRDQFNVSVFLIEHDMSLVMGISEHIIVLDYGRVIADGAPDEVKNDPAVLTAYLGSDSVQ